MERKFRTVETVSRLPDKAGNYFVISYGPQEFNMVMTWNELIGDHDTVKEYMDEQKKQWKSNFKYWLERIAIILILLSSTVAGMGQYHDTFREKPPPAIYLAYQPWDHGLGIRGDVHINYWAGVYGSASYGQWGLYRQSGLGQHMKLTAGILIPWGDYSGGQFDWSIGLNYHKVWGEVVVSEIFKDDPVFHKNWSFELGLTCKLKRFALGVRTDILRWEPCIDVGIPLGWKKNSYHRKRYSGK